MSIFSIWFFLFSIVGAVIYQFRDNVAYRQAVLLVLNIALLVAFAGGPVQLWATLGFAVLGYVALVCVRRFAGSWILWMSAITLVALFMYLKRYTISEFLPSPSIPFTALGLSYILFRVLHLVIDAHDDPQGRPPGPISYFNYLFSFLTLVSGPIQRYPDFAAQVASAKSTPQGAKESYRNLDRLFSGILKLALISALLTTAYQNLADELFRPETLSNQYEMTALFGLVCVVFLINMYVNFSGYMDIVISIGAWFGFSLPENFNKPFRAGDLLDFWSRWHMTLSSWFRDYVFTPLMKALTRWRPSPKWTTVLGAIALFVSFTLMGVWHGTTSIFLIYGLTLGAGVSLTSYVQTRLRKSLGKARYSQLIENPINVYLGRGFTFAYIAIALTALWIDWARLVALSHAVSPIALLGLVVGLTCLAAVALAMLDFLLGVATRYLGSISASVQGTWLGAAKLAVMLFIVFQTLFISGISIPEFVYEVY